MSRYSTRINRAARLTALGVLLPILAMAQNYVFGPNVRVNDDPAGSVEHSTMSSGGHCMAARGDTVYLAMEDYRQNYEKHIFVARSTNAGRTFQPNVRVDNTIPGCEGVLPSLALDGNGVIHIVWSNINLRWADFPYYSRSTDGGRTFSTPIRICDSFALAQHGVSAIATSRTGRLVYVARAEQCYQPDSANRIVLNRSTDGGASFLPCYAQVTPGAIGGYSYPSVAVLEDTIVLVSWFQNSPSHGLDVYFARSANGGVSFGPSLLLNDTVGNGNHQEWCSVGVDSLGRVFVTYIGGTMTGLLGLAVSTDTGRTFRHEVGIPGTTGGRYTSLEGRPGGQLYLAYNYPDPLDRTDVGFVYSPDGGETFLPRADPCDVGWGIYKDYAAVAANEDGTAFVAWSDARNDPDSLFDLDVYFATGTMAAIEDKPRESAEEVTYLVVPSPVMGLVCVEYCIPKAGNVRVTVCDLIGRQVAELSDKIELAGRHHLTWSGRNQHGRQVGSGVYFVTVQTAFGVTCRKFEYVRE
jgi:hypothetical protein